MELSQLEITGSRALNLESFTAEDWAIWERLPQGYRDFLTKHNGALVDSDKACFATKIQRVHEGKVYDNATNAVEELWCFLSYQNGQPMEDKPTSLLHEHFDRHMGEDFLPDGVYVIGRCIQDSLMCLSVNETDYGAIYYWEWYWQYPWYKEFFEHRVEAVNATYPDAKAALGDENSPRYQEVVDAFNYATLVKINNSFNGFIGSLFEEAE